MNVICLQKLSLCGIITYMKKSRASYWLRTNTYLVAIRVQICNNSKRAVKMSSILIFCDVYC